MKKILSVKQIRQIEAKEFKKRGNTFSLMVNAGKNCAKKIIKLIKFVWNYFLASLHFLNYLFFIAHFFCQTFNII